MREKRGSCTAVLSTGDDRQLGVIQDSRYPTPVRHHRLSSCGARELVRQAEYLDCRETGCRQLGGRFCSNVSGQLQRTRFAAADLAVSPSGIIWPNITMNARTRALRYLLGYGFLIVLIGIYTPASPDATWKNIVLTRFFSHWRSLLCYLTLLQSRSISRIFSSCRRTSRNCF